MHANRVNLHTSTHTYIHTYIYMYVAILEHIHTRTHQALASLYRIIVFKYLPCLLSDGDQILTVVFMPNLKSPA